MMKQEWYDYYSSVHRLFFCLRESRVHKWIKTTGLWNPERLYCRYIVGPPKWYKFIPRRPQPSHLKTTKQVAALATVSKVLPTVAEGASTARHRQPLAHLPSLSSQSRPTQRDELPAESSPVEPSLPLQPLATVLIWKTKRHLNRKLQHSEGDLNVQK